jgi:hypothetical protein
MRRMAIAFHRILQQATLDRIVIDNKDLRYHARLLATVIRAPISGCC